MSKFIKDSSGGLINLSKVDMVYKEVNVVKVAWEDGTASIIKNCETPNEADNIMDKITKYLEALDV